MKAANGKTLLSSVAFGLLVGLLALSAGLYFYNIVRWTALPELGWGFRFATGIGVVGFVRDYGKEAGFEEGDRIIEINGKRFSSLEELRAAINRGIGEKNAYLLERNGRDIRLEVENVPMGFRGVLTISGVLYLVGLTYICIGIIVFLMRRHDKTSWIFILVTATFGLQIIYMTRASKITPSWLENLPIFVNTFAPALLIHLAGSFPAERRFIKKYPYIMILPYICSALLFFGIRKVATTIGDVPTILYALMMAYLAAAVLLFLVSCAQLWLTSPSEIVRLRSRLILLGSAIAASVPLLESISSTFLQVYILPSFNYAVPFFIVFPLSIGYAIVKHDLFDIDAIIKRSYGYILTTGAIAGTYGLFVLISNLAFGRFEITKSPAFPLIFILAVIFFFNPIRNRAQRFIDRVFYRLEYDYQATVQKISETMRSLLKLDQIGRVMMEVALNTMFIDSGCVMLLNSEKTSYECLIKEGERERRAGKGDVAGEKYPEVVKTDLLGPEGVTPQPPGLKLAADGPLIQKIASRKKEVTIYDIQEDPFFEDERESCQETFDSMEATLILPLIYEDRLTGLISLGDKKSGKFYRREDINLLNILANQGAVAMENALLLEEVIEKERMEEELAIARELQTSMLPATCPEIEQFEIAALSIPAKEVGGDFYDFIEMGEERLGLVIGDVTGKSVSGALVMSASRSVFRMLSEEELTVGEIMMRANRRTKKDIKSGMFVALLYAVIDAKDRSLSLCSAGQTQPIHLPATKGEARLVQTKGDTFPLGILEDVDYQETRLQLEPGDKVIFYTDGIVEAMNEKQEIFGFERLLQVVQEARGMTADSLLKEIMNKLNSFVGAASQHDDLTLIAINVVEGE